MARGLDHLVHGVHDLDRAGQFFEQLGFTVGARNRHPWGTHNRIVQFPGFFLELITVGEPDLIPDHAEHRFSFGAAVRDALAAGEGISMLVLESRDALADNAAFHALGLGGTEPFFFERQASRPDGTSVRVAFTLAFASQPRTPAPSFFVCQQHEPQNFWNPRFQAHANGASSVAAVTLVASDPAAHIRFFEGFTGAVGPVSHEAGWTLALPRGCVETVTPDHAGKTTGFFGNGAAHPALSLAGVTVRLPDQVALQRRLDEQGIAHARYGSRVVVEAFGAAIAFEQA
ncbi:MAG: VOC family protein [Beijerinckiaceae bacterium]|jgi:catechol 2,3-dioxygenase-like lactoylglutathione lyase family enzyme|nr:VOC family protein [Beijerinckiaceae bacterium]